MSPEKTGRRQERLAQLQRRQQQTRLIVIGLIVMGAALVVFAVIWPQLRPIGETVSVTPPVAKVVTGVPTAFRPPKNANGLSLGDAGAPVTIDVFEDFQCPACKYFTESIETRLIQNLIDTGKARYVFHNYPFLDDRLPADQDHESDQAANASMCANEQGKFWEMHGTLFANWNGENEGAFSDARLQAMAQSIGLQMDTFKECFTANKYKAEIQADFDLGKKMGVSGTPTVFVNGSHVGQPGKIATYEDIKQAVDQTINK